MYRYLGKYGCIEQVLLYLDKCGCVWASMVVFGQVWLYLGKNDCIWAKWLYLRKMVKIGHNGCIWGKWL